MSTQRKRKASRDEQARERREEILTVALKLFSRTGFAGTSTRRIAQAAGINESLVFHYFPTKTALLLALVTRRHTFAGRVVEALEQSAQKPASQVVRAIAAGLPVLLREETDFVGLLMAESHTNPEVYEAMGATMKVVVSRFADYLATRVKAGELRAHVPLEAASRGFFGGFLFFFITHHRLGRAAWAREAAAFAEPWAKTWLAGLQKH